MQLSCLYHPTLPIRVLDDEVEYNRLLNSGEWFESPKDAKEYGDSKNGERLHVKKRQRRKHVEQETQDGGIST
jgi:hypothetical protein